MNDKLTHGSLFSGIGGSEIAAEAMGWKNMFHCEINPFGRKILNYWFPNSKSYEDITKTDFTRWRGKINVLTGGFPCQPFSVAGQRKGKDDDRYLWPEFKRAIREIQPDWVVGENVAGILTMVQPGEEVEVDSQSSLFGEDNRKRVLLRREYVVETICRDLEREGYSVQPVVIPACAVGAPHRRDRVWFVAHRNYIADTDGRADGGKSRENADSCKEERLQERDKIRESDESDNVRPEMQDIVTHYDEYGHIPRETGEGLETGRRRNTSEWVDGLHGFSRDAPDTDSHRWRDWKNQQVTISERKGTADIGTFSEDGASSETGNYQCETCNISSVSDEQTRYRIRNHAEKLPDWSGFPTQSPVCSRDDGISTRLDGITFSKWRNESIKAYGNAILPQVVYEIFKAIEEAQKDFSDK